VGCHWAVSWEVIKKGHGWYYLTHDSMELNFPMDDIKSVMSNCSYHCSSVDVAFGVIVMSKWVKKISKTLKGRKWISNPTGYQDGRRKMGLTDCVPFNKATASSILTGKSVCSYY